MKPSLDAEIAITAMVPVKLSIALIIEFIIGFTKLLISFGASISICNSSVPPPLIIPKISPQLLPTPIVVLTLGILIAKLIPSESPIILSLSTNPPNVVFIWKPSRLILPITESVLNSDLIRLVMLSPNLFVNTVKPSVVNSIS